MPTAKVLDVFKTRAGRRTEASVRHWRHSKVGGFQTVLPVRGDPSRRGGGQGDLGNPSSPDSTFAIAREERADFRRTPRFEKAIYRRSRAWSPAWPDYATGVLCMVEDGDRNRRVCTWTRQFTRGLIAVCAVLVAGCGGSRGPAPVAVTSSSTAGAISSAAQASGVPATVQSASTAHPSKAGSPSPASSLASAPGSASGPSTSASSTHVIMVGQVSLRVPSNWTLGKQVNISEFDALTELGAAFPNQNKASPFFSESISTSPSSAQLSLGELSVSGDFYYVSVMVPLDELATLRQVVSQMTVPPVATAADAVRFLTEQAARGKHWELVSSNVGPDEWLLAQGEPTAGQQPFALFNSTDSGTTWSVDRVSQFKGKFLGVEGLAAMLFWTQNDGVIAELSGWVNALLVYRSTDGGKTWSSQRMAIPGSPSGLTAPTITRSAGALGEWPESAQRGLAGGSRRDIPYITNQEISGE